MKEVFINVGLPKTGTSFLYNYVKLLSNHCELLSVSDIKEPTYWSNNSEHRRKIGKIIASGNYKKSLSWYLNLFNADSAYGFDFSTQYWIDLKQINEINERNLGIKKFAIRRAPDEQIKSYLSHLCRGYFSVSELREKVFSDDHFLAYLRKMYYFDYSLLKDTVIIDFDNLKREPRKALEEICVDCVTLPEIKLEESSIGRNQAIKPKYKFINRILFTGAWSHFKRFLPNGLYKTLIKTRKRIIRSNGEEIANASSFQSEIFEEIINEIRKS